jgi:hypothetical protein
MRFMFLVKSSENCGLPPKELMEAIWRDAERATKAGELIASGGLAPTAQSIRVQVRNGKLVTTDGPYAESKEVIGGYAVFELKSKEEALERVQAFMDLHRKYWPGWQGETEIRQIYGQEEFIAHAAEQQRQRAAG